MADRETLEKFAVGVRTDREAAEAAATHAQESLVRLASGITPLGEIDPDQIRAAADDFASAVERYKLLAEISTRVRHILM